MDGQLNLLREALRLLSLSYKEQRKELPSFVGNVMTDIVEDFINSFYLVPQLLDKKLLTDKALKKLVYCYVQIQTNYQNSEWSNHKAFEDHMVWNLVRNYAREALEDINNSNSM